MIKDKVWVLHLKTTLPGTTKTFFKQINEMYAFDNFENAKKKVKEILEKYSRNNKMFNANGELSGLKKYKEVCCPDPDDPEFWDDEQFDDLLGEDNDQRDIWRYYIQVLADIVQIISEIFAGNDCTLSREKGYKGLEYIDANLEATFQDDGFELIGAGDYGCHIGTNLFEMNDAKKQYYLYIDDLLGQSHQSIFSLNLQCVTC